MSRIAPSAPESGAIAKSAQLTSSLEKAHRLAVEFGHGMVTLEHVLMSMVGESEALSVLGASTVNPDNLKADVAALLGRLPRDGAPGAAIMPNNDLLKVLRLASMAAQQSARRQIDGAIVLAAIIGDGTTPSAALLKQHGLTFNEVIRVLQSGAKPAAASPPPPPGPAQIPPPAPVQSQPPPQVPMPPPQAAMKPVAPPVAVAPSPPRPPSAPEPVAAKGAPPPFEPVLPNPPEPHLRADDPAFATAQPELPPAPPSRPQSTDELLASVRARLKDVVPQSPPKPGNSTLRAVEPSLARPPASGSSSMEPAARPSAAEAVEQPPALEIPAMPWQSPRVEPSLSVPAPQSELVPDEPPVLPEPPTLQLPEPVALPEPAPAPVETVVVPAASNDAPLPPSGAAAAKSGGLDQALAQVKLESVVPVTDMPPPSPPPVDITPPRAAPPPLNPAPVSLTRRDTPPSLDAGPSASALNDIPTLQPRGAPPPLPSAKAAGVPAATLPAASTPPLPPQMRGDAAGSMPVPPAAPSGPQLVPQGSQAPGGPQMMPPLPQLPAPQVDLAAVADNLPVDIPRGEMTTVEIMLPRRAFELMMPQSPPRAPFWPPVRAVTLKLYSSGPGVSVEPVTAETQFVRVWRAPNDLDGLSWRWKVKPHGDGPIGLTLALGVRNISMEGVGPEHWWPEETVGVSVGGGRRSGKRLLIWGVILSMLAGGIGALVLAGKAGLVMAWVMNTFRSLVGG